MAITGTGKTSVAAWGGMHQFIYGEDYTKAEVTEVLGGVSNRRKRRENLEEVRKASLAALQRRRRREELEEQRRQALAGEANAKNVDQILKKVFTIDAEIEQIHDEMIQEELAQNERKQKRRKRDRLAVMLLMQ